MTRRRRRLSWTLMVATVALLAAVSVVATVHARHGPIPGGVYNGTLVDSDVICSRADFTLGEEFTIRLNSEGSEATAIVEMTVREVTYLFDPVGTFSWPLDIPIAADGSFEAEFDVNGLAFVQLEGRFQDDAVSGSYRVDVDGIVQCEGTFSAHGAPPRTSPPSTWTAPIELPHAACGRGFVSVTVSSDGSSLIQAKVTDLRADGALVSGSAAFDEGAVPVAADGSFGWVYFPANEPGLEIALNGTFARGFSGLVTVSPSTCGPIGFRLPSEGSQVLPRTGDVAASGDGALESAAALPGSGTSTTAQRSRIGPAWTALAAGGALVLLVGLALLRRRRA